MSVYVFDFDGVIVDSTPVAIEICKAWCKKEGLKEPTLEDFKGLYENNFYEGMIAYGFDPSHIKSYFPWVQEELHRRKDDMPPHPGMIELLRELEPLYIVTSNFRHIIEERIMEMDIDVDDILSADEGLSKKEKIERIKKAHPAERVVYVGDTAGDMLEAKKAGVIGIGVTWGVHEEARLLKHTTHIAKSVSQLRQLLHTAQA